MHTAVVNRQALWVLVEQSKISIGIDWNPHARSERHLVLSIFDESVAIFVLRHDVERLIERLHRDNQLDPKAVAQHIVRNRERIVQKQIEPHLVAARVGTQRVP